MHIHLIMVICCGIVILSSCENSVDSAAEKAAIIAVNEKQMQAFITHDYQAETEVWSQEPCIVHYQADGSDIGWQAISSRYKTIFHSIERWV